MRLMHFLLLHLLQWVSEEFNHVIGAYVQHQKTNVLVNWGGCGKPMGPARMGQTWGQWMEAKQSQKVWGDRWLMAAS